LIAVNSALSTWFRNSITFASPFMSPHRTSVIIADH
jgi:hypothetical protein